MAGRPGCRSSGCIYSQFSRQKEANCMLEVPLSRIAAVEAARLARELQGHLQGALELEYSFIPPHLTALFSLRDGANSQIREILYRVVVDKMLHVALIANILNAIGCPPDLSGQRLGRGFPTPLPLDATGIDLCPKKFSPELIRNVVITTDHADVLAPRSPGPTAVVDRSRGTLVQFYRAVIGKFEELGDLAFDGDPALQFADAVSYSERELFRVSDVASASRALRLVSGEGDITDSPARSSRLERGVDGRRPDAISFDPAGVINIVENSKASMYAPGSPVRAAVDEFNVAYGSILRALTETFNGRPERYEFAVSSMYRLTSLSRSIVVFHRGDGTFAAPSFECKEGP